MSQKSKCKEFNHKETLTTSRPKIDDWRPTNRLMIDDWQPPNHHVNFKLWFIFHLRNSFILQVTLIFSRLLWYLSYVHTVRWLCRAASVFSRGNNMSLDNHNYLLMSSGLFTLKIHKIRQLTATVRLMGKNKQEKSALQNARLLVIIIDSRLYYCYNIV